MISFLFLFWKTYLPCCMMVAGAFDDIAFENETVAE